MACQFTKHLGFSSPGQGLDLSMRELLMHSYRFPFSPWYQKPFFANPQGLTESEKRWTIGLTLQDDKNKSREIAEAAAYLSTMK